MKYDSEAILKPTGSVAWPSSAALGVSPTLVFYFLPFACCLLLTLAAFQFIPSLRLEVGWRDQRALAGVNDVELLGGRKVRWTNGAGRITLPRTLVNRPLLLDVGLLNARPPGQPAPAVRLSASGTAPVAFSVPPSLSGEGRRYTLLLPPGTTTAVEVFVDSDVLLLPADPRPLGVALTGATLRPASGGLRLPPPLTLLHLALVVAGGGLALWLAGGGLALAMALPLAALTLLCLGFATRPMEVLPFLPRLAGLALLACGTVGLAYLIAPPLAGGKREGAVSRSYFLPPASWPMVRGGDLAIYMGLAWWAMPLFQLLMRADGARPAVAPQTIFIGWTLLAGLLIMLALRLWRRFDVAPYIMGLLLGASLAHGAYLVWYGFQRSAPDFWIHFKGARSFIRDGLPLYDLPSIEANHFGFAYKWPPLYAALLSPFVYQSGELVLLGHRVMNTLLLAATAGLLLWEGREQGNRGTGEQRNRGTEEQENRGTGEQRNRRTEEQENRGTEEVRHSALGVQPRYQAGFGAVAAGMLMLFNFRPATDTIALGQFDIIVLFCCTVALLAARRGRDGLAGALIAFLGLIKLYPVLLLAFFLLQRRWRALWGFVAGGLVCTAYSVATLGWQNHWIYLTQVVSRIGGGTSWIENQTFNGFASRLFAPSIAADKFDYLPVTLATYAFFGVGLGLAAFLTLRSTKAAFFVQYSLFVILMVMAVPAAWMHYHTVTILPFAVLLLYYGKGELPFGRAATMALAYALLSYGNQWSFFNGEVLGGLSMLGYSYKFYGLALLFGLGALTAYEASLEKTMLPSAERYG